MKFNMGCGHNKLPGHVNVDAYPEGNPDIVFDLETVPWPWADSVAERVVFNHSLEHMGQQPQVFLNIMKELYRICKPGAEVVIVVPHHRHDFFVNDPTHVRPITVDVLMLFSKAANEDWKVRHVPNTPLAHYLGVDFKIEEYRYVLDDQYREAYLVGNLTDEEIQRKIREQNNVVMESHFRLTVLKDGAATTTAEKRATRRIPFWIRLKRKMKNVLAAAFRD